MSCRYIDRQQRQVDRFERQSDGHRPALDMMTSPEGEDGEAQGRAPFRGQASRINGVRNSDVAILIVHLKRGGAHV